MSLFKQALLVLVLVVAAGVGWYVYQHPAAVGLAGDTAGEESARGRSGAPGGPGAREGNRIPGLIGRGGAVNVITQAVEIDPGGETVMALGTAKAARSVTLYPQVTGVVADILFRPGSPVSSGAALLKLEDSEQRVAAEKARVSLNQARATLERSKTLARSKTISDAALLDADTAAQLAEIEVRSAEIALRRRTVTAPFAGVTGLTDISVGDLVTTSTAITRLDDLSTVRVAFEVPERWAGRIERGHPITATAQGLAGSEFAGSVTGIDNRIDETTRTLRLEAELANDDRALRAGMAITVMLPFETDRELAVPSLSVQWDRRGSFVWKVAEGAARRADISIVRRESGVVIVRGDVEAGDRVVVEGVQRLRDGAKVAEVDETPAMIGDEDADEDGKDEVPEVSGAGAAGRTRS
ncbi:MAG: efflux RND transporter periplasmic adaptor subunit [Propylenella sp.]